MYYDGVPAVCIAVEQNKPKIVEYLVKKYDCKKLKDSINGRNALHYAAMNTKDIYEEILDILLKNGFDPNELDNDKNTPINFAVCCNVFIPTISFTLLEKGADPNLLNNKNQNSLFFVIENTYGNRFRYLLKKGADINQQDIDGNTPLHNYLLKSPERDKGISLFLKGKANLKSVNNKKQTPLHLAVYSNDASAVCQLVMDKADLNQPDVDGNTALHYIAKYAPKNRPMMKHISNNCYWNVDFSIKNNEGKTPLDIEPDCFYQSELKGRLPAKE
jgi:ankyrin repeat protein